MKLLSLALLCAAATASVVELGKDNFDAILAANKYVLVKFFAPWCGHCKKIAPEFEEASKQLDGVATLADLDATQDDSKAIAERFEVRGYPTLFFFINGEKFEYDGGRTTDTIVQWVKQMTGPAIQEVSVAPAVTAGSPQVIITGEQVSEELSKLAGTYRKKYSFFFIKGGESKVSIQHLNEETVTTTDVTNTEAITSLLDANLLPLYGPLDGDSYGKYMQSGKGLIWTLYPMEEEKDLSKVERDTRVMMTEVAKSFSGKYFVTYTDTLQFKSALEGMLGVSEFPTIAVNKKAGDKLKYLYTGEMTAEKIIAFINGVEDGSVPPTLKSEPVPETQDEVNVVVGETLKSAVFHAEKDVFLEIYAPWCGHCKKLAPELEKLGRKVRSLGLEGMLTIAKMDGTANDSTEESIAWEGFPTIYYVKAGSSEPAKYDGPRDAKGMWKWIKKNHSKGEEIKRIVAESKKGQDEELPEEKEEL